LAFLVVKKAMRTQACDLATRIAPESSHGITLDERVQGMPGASRTRSLVCKWKKHTSKSPQVRRFDRPFPAQWFYGFLRALLGDQTFVVTVACERPRQLDASLGAPGPHVFAVRSGIARLTMHLRPSHPASRVVTFAKRPLSRRTAGKRT